MLIIIKFLFHFICSIGRFFRKIFQLILGRRHDELETSLSKTEPVTLEHIRIIGEMENDPDRPYQSFSTAPKIPQAEWNSWGAEDIFRQKQLANNSPTAEQSDAKIDYFSDIAATVKKTPKIVLKKRINDNDNFNLNDQRLNRLQMTNDELVDFQPGLNEWQDSDGNIHTTGHNTWDGDDDFNELSQEANEAMRETRRIERERKIREHQQRKFEKEASRTSIHKRDGLS
ncbi:unnamed protein product [Rotaria socialis]|uniref:Receptor-binding cancer antigen n=1 Tax=Rotaria socialis TaxID=392032 RepID=A0A818A5X0_9BILA|nr:unnamed protein product [Rotaria socialis]CAF3418570.1 unnamed protein product [Rotaria socialis]CAF3583433.1 unnamed protein product [Rotaria socialis]CAF4678270.1 unnamed protein product [Rotaria socialis]